MRQAEKSWRGMTTGGMVTLGAGAVALLVIGFVLGRASDSQAITTPAEGGVAEVDVAAGQVAMSKTPEAGARTGASAAPRDRATSDGGSDVPGDAPFAFDPPVLDFGLVGLDEEMRGTVKLTNTGSEPLQVLAMKSDCKCTTLQDLTGTAIPPGETVELYPVVDGRSYPGNALSKITFVFRGFGSYSYRVRSRVSRAVWADPPNIRLKEPDEFAGLVTISAIDDRPFRIYAANGAPPEYVDDFDPATDEPRTSYLLAWDLGRFDPSTCEDAEGNRMPRWWVVESDHPDAPLLDVRVVHNPCSLPEPLQGRKWILDEMRMVVGEIVAGEAAEFTVGLKWLHGTTPHDTIQRVESESDLFHASLLGQEEIDGEMQYRVRITPRADHRGLLKGDVRFFSHGLNHSQTLTVIARVVDPATKTAAATGP